MCKSEVYNNMKARRVSIERSCIIHKVMQWDLRLYCEKVKKSQKNEEDLLII